MLSFPLGSSSAIAMDPEMVRILLHHLTIMTPLITTFGVVGMILALAFFLSEPSGCTDSTTVSNDDLLASKYAHIVREEANQWKLENKQFLRLQRKRRIRFAKIFQSILYGCSVIGHTKSISSVTFSPTNTHIQMNYSSSKPSLHRLAIV